MATYSPRAIASVQGPSRPFDQLEDERPRRAGIRVAENHAADGVLAGRMVVDDNLRQVFDERLHAADPR